MNIVTFKTKSFALIAIAVLMLSATAMMMPIKAQVVLPSNAVPTNVQSGASIPLPSGVTPSLTVTPTAFLSASPSPIGVGQELLVNVWLEPPIFVGRYFTGYTVTITLPSGTTQTIGPFNSYPGDTTGWFNYNVTEAGTYKLQFNFPGGYFKAGNYSVASGTFMGQQVDSFVQDVYYAPAESPVTDIVAQSAMVPSWLPSPLPGAGDYWSHPISPNNREWWSIGGWYPNSGVLGGGSNWPANTNPYMSNYNYIPYVTGPTSAHIVWDVQGGMGGLIGGAEGPTTLLSGGGNPSVIYDGRCYETITTVLNGVPQEIWECYNLQTGQMYWEQPVPTYQTQTTFGPTVSPPASAPTIVFPNNVVTGASAQEEGIAETSYSGLVVYLVFVGSSRWIAFDPFSGIVEANVSIAPLTTGTEYMNNYFLSVQNIGTGASPNYRLINWTVGGVTGAGSAGYAVPYALEVMSNITWPWSSLPATTDYQAGISALVTGITSTATGVGNSTNIQAASLTTGAVLWSVTVPYTSYSGSDNIADQGKIAVLLEGPGYMAWNLATGTLAWTAQAMDYPWGSACFGAYAVQSAYGQFYHESYDGVYAFNWATGQIAWHFAPPTTPFEVDTTANGTTVNSFNSGGVVADGMLYVAASEHTYPQPLTRGLELYCINATTGQCIWNVTGTMTPGGVSAGYLTASDSYNGYMYVFGMGLSATTVSAPQTAITEGQQVIISGKVLDQSPGQPGTPCVSDASMGAWMEYLHMQTAEPTGVTGVPVSIDAIDPNGNPVHIATVTTDGASGTFGYTWTAPAVPGQYKIIATYAGDDSYSYSSATTYAAVVAPPTATATPTPTPTPTAAPSNLANTTDLMTYIAIATIAIIIAIAIATVLILRRPK